MLEVGCGPGHLLADMASSGAQCCGADQSRQMLALADRHTRQRGAGAGLVRCLGQRLPFRDDAFDTVVLCFSGLAWLPRVLAEVRRVMTSAGSLVVVDEVFFPRSTLATRFIRVASSLYDCEAQDTTPHDVPLREAGLDPRIAEHSLKDSVVRLLVAEKTPISVRSMP